MASRSSSSSSPMRSGRSDLMRNRKPREFGRRSINKSPFPHVGSYMAEKNHKLREQFDTSASSLVGGGIGCRKGIFFGISIFVDGFTVPSSQELRACMMKHGGRYENYFSRRTVTHIICSHLADSKMRNFRAFSRGLPVVKPAWVVDSVAANKILSCVPYQLNELENGTHKQQKLSSFFSPTSISMPKNAESAAAPSSILPNGSVPPKNDRWKYLMVDEERECSKFREESECEKLKYLLVDEEGECSKFKEDSACIENDKFCNLEYADLTIGDEKEQYLIGQEQNGAYMNGIKSKELLANPYFGRCNQLQEAKEEDFHQIRLSTSSSSKPDSIHINTCTGDYRNMMPESLSQLDITVLNELPEELKDDILKSLPLHRASSFPGNDPSTSGNTSPSDVKDSGNSKMSLWMGTPPTWVEKFKNINCSLLNIIAAQYSRSDMNDLLSPTLQNLNPLLYALSDLNAGVSDESLSELFELFKQYIELKVETDIEELYLCLRILGRLATDFEFLFQLHHLILPILQASFEPLNINFLACKRSRKFSWNYLIGKAARKYLLEIQYQASISEYYGGNLRLPFAKE